MSLNPSPLKIRRAGRRCGWLRSRETSLLIEYFALPISSLIHCVHLASTVFNYMYRVMATCARAVFLPASTRFLFLPFPSRAILLGPIPTSATHFLIRPTGTGPDLNGDAWLPSRSGLFADSRASGHSVITSAGTDSGIICLSCPTLPCPGPRCCSTTRGKSSPWGRQPLPFKSQPARLGLQF